MPAAGISWVGVLPTHRRRGVLRALMTHQLHEIHERGREPLAILWASEPPIYGRFGYGLASRAYALDVSRSPDALRADVPTDPTLRLRLVPADDWKITAEVYAQVAAQRPGMLVRDDRWWRKAVRDVPSMREGRSALRCVVAEDDSGVRGYARYATKQDWGPGRPKGTVHRARGAAVDGPARALLYRFLFDQDLMSQVDVWNVAVDDPLLLWLENVRSATPRWLDALYVRLIDVPAALKARTYTAPVDVVLDVTDPLCPWNEGRWQLVARGGEVSCDRDRPVGRPVDVGHRARRGLPRWHGDLRPRDGRADHRAHARRRDERQHCLPLQPGTLVPGHLLARYGEREPVETGADPGSGRTGPNARCRTTSRCAGWPRPDRRRSAPRRRCAHVTCRGQTSRRGKPAGLRASAPTAAQAARRSTRSAPASRCGGRVARRR